MGAPALEDAPCRRACTVLAEKERTVVNCALRVAKHRAPSITNDLVSALGFVFLKEIGKVSHKGENCNHHRPSKPNEE
jgi:hypothetical protein